MNKIDEWVYDVHRQNKLVFNIQSYSLKKALSKEVTKEYMKSGIFTEFQKGLAETVVKKSKSFNQNRYLRPVEQHQPPELGATEMDYNQAHEPQLQ